MGRLEEEPVAVIPVCRIPLSICCAKRRATSFTHVSEGGTPVYDFLRVCPHIFSGKSVVVDV